MTVVSEARAADRREPAGVTTGPEMPGWLERLLPFRRRSMEVAGHAVHYIDEGEGQPVVMIHGNPTWCFLWRHVVKGLQGRPVRLLAPDLVGFGLSDKPRRPNWHRLDRHLEVLQSWAESLGLERVIVVGQDWGGPMAAGLASRLGDRVAGAVFGNTALLLPKQPVAGTWFHRLSHVPLISDALFYGLNFPVPWLRFAQGDRHSIDAEAKRAYEYPFRHWSDRAGCLALARMVPHKPDHPSLGPLTEVDRWVRAYKGPVSLVWGMRDPLLGRAHFRLRKVWEQARFVETQAGHFLQEEVGDVIAEEIWKLTTPSA